MRPKGAVHGSVNVFVETGFVKIKDQAVQKWSHYQKTDTSSFVHQETEKLFHHIYSFC